MENLVLLRMYTITVTMILMASCTLPEQSTSRISNSEPGSTNKSSPLTSPERLEANKALDIYKKEPNCISDNYKMYRSFLQNQVKEMSKRTYPSGLMSILLEIERSYGQEFIDLGNIALEKKCFPEARDNYLEVIDTFVGENFASLRQRAQIGLDDVRDAKKQVKPVLQRQQSRKSE